MLELHVEISIHILDVKAVLLKNLECLLLEILDKWEKVYSL